MRSYFHIWIWTSNRIDLISSVFLKNSQFHHLNFQKKKIVSQRCTLVGRLTCVAHSYRSRLLELVCPLESVRHKHDAEWAACANVHVSSAHHLYGMLWVHHMSFEIRAMWFRFLIFILWYLLRLNFNFELVYGVGKLSMSSSCLGENRIPKLVLKAILWRDKIPILSDPLRKDYGVIRKEKKEVIIKVIKTQREKNTVSRN